MQACGGRGHRSGFAGINGLIALPISRTIGSVNIGRKRRVADALDCAKKILDGSKPDAALTEAASGCDGCLQLILLAEKKSFAHSDFSPWAHQALPFIFIGIMRKLTSQEDFNPAMQKVACRRVSRADGLSFDPAPSAKEPCGKHSRVIEHDQIVGTEQFRKV